MPPPPLIALEEHFLHPTVLSTPSIAQTYSEQLKHVPGLREKLLSLSDLRLTDMDNSQISLQILSHAPTPGSPSPAQCVEINNAMASAVKAHTDRFAALACLPMSDASAAATELSRCVHELKFVGALVDNHCHGTFYDGASYLPFWTAAAELNAPIYLHPTWSDPSTASLEFLRAATKGMAASAMGWHNTTAIHFLRLYASGLFNKLPNLQIVLGHFGEGLPFYMERINVLSRRWGSFERSFEKVYRENLYITTSGVWGLAPMACILRNTPIERVMFSVDYPFANNADGLKWWEEFEGSGMVTKEQRELIAHGNAERVFGIRAPRR
ncbi:hypothetical protein B0A48_03560 [Cryoendolithus antarcticus]|uniref:Amidohydrolase-related domain-containing protein n=1 Tax=Cryoendolithus antarcticus TaxID=1507870 RepID=A0A1V8TKC2_9PEZI|nr:hypothetical protein B0A48_03560 [Cryoendolithus antarcticus]